MLGIRPEALSDRPREGAGAARPGSLDAQVALVQPLGDRLNVYLSTPKHDNLIAQVSGDSRVRAGDAISVTLDMNRAHFFAADEEGAALALNRERWGSSGRPGARVGGVA
jgi:ABC-type sugar transport system ATPase subunit